MVLIAGHKDHVLFSELEPKLTQTNELLKLKKDHQSNDMVIF